MKKILTLPLALLFALPTSAQDEASNLTVTAQMRNRGEMLHGFGTLRPHGEKPELMVGERVRVTTDWSRGDISARVAFQHTGVWGDEPQVGGKGSLSMSEAWAKYDFKENIFFSSYAQVGRQTLSYDDERILGAYDWSTTGRSHDALKVVMKSAHNELHAVLSFSQNSTTPDGFYDNVAGYKNMQMLWYHNNHLPFLQASLLFLNTGLGSGTEEEHSTEYLQTFGTYLSSTPMKRLSANASFYYQTGKNAAEEKVDAFLAAVGAEYEATKTLTVGAGVDIASGTKPRKPYGHKEPLPTHTFQSLYGSANRFHGAMGYFASEMPEAGLVDVKASGEMTLPKGITLRGDYHYFQLLQKFNYKGYKNPPGKALGHEIDLKLACSPLKYLDVEAGYSVMFPLRTMGLLLPTGNTGAWQHWAWVSMNLNTNIFKHKAK